MGKTKIAEMLCRAGLHLGASTVGRMLKDKPAPKDDETDADIASDENRDASSVATSDAKGSEPKRLVTAKRPNHVWHVDLTVVPTLAGMWCAWLPFALSQCWPFCWWSAIVVDHYSRRVMGFTVFKNQPTSEDVRAFLGRAISKAGATPKYLISDKGVQFWCKGYKHWCERRKIKPRFGAIGQYGSIAIIERFMRTLKEGCTRESWCHFIATASAANYNCSLTGTTNHALTQAWTERLPTRFTIANERPTSAPGLNRVNAGRVVHLAPRRKRL